MKEELRDWVVDGKRAGRTRSAKGFTFATVEGAGHMVGADSAFLGILLTIVMHRCRMINLRSRWSWSRDGWPERIYKFGNYTQLSLRCDGPIQRLY